MDLNTKVESVFEDYKRDLERLVSIASVLDEEGQKPFGQEIQKALEEVLAIAKEMGFNTFIDPKAITVMRKLVKVRKCLVCWDTWTLYLPEILHHGIRILLNWLRKTACCLDVGLR